MDKLAEIDAIIESEDITALRVAARGLVRQLAAAESDLEHAERNEEEQALTIQILSGKLSQAQELWKLRADLIHAYEGASQGEHGGLWAEIERVNKELDAALSDPTSVSPPRTEEQRK